MFELSLPAWLIGTIVLTVLLNLVVCYVIMRAPAYTAVQKLIQILLVWLIPIAGAVAFFWFLWQDRRRAQAVGYVEYESDKPRLPPGIGGGV